MSTATRVKQAVMKLDKQGSNWAYETWEQGGTAYFSFEADRSAQLVREALWMIFKSQRRQLIHNGRKP